LNRCCSEPSSSTSRSPPIDLPRTSQKIGTHPTLNVDLLLLQLNGYKPLYRDLGEGGRRGGLTGEAVGLMVADGVEGGT
jgi:hypothetical protein